MKNTPVVLAAMVGTAMAAPQSQKAPAAAAPAGCSTTYADSFEISIVAAPEEMKRLEDEICSILPCPHADAIYTSGFAVCDDNLLALGDQKTFFKCNSGNFANLYDRNWAPQCSPVAFYVPLLRQEQAVRAGRLRCRPGARDPFFPPRHPDRRWITPRELAVGAALGYKKGQSGDSKLHLFGSSGDHELCVCSCAVPISRPPGRRATRRGWEVRFRNIKDSLAAAQEYRAAAREYRAAATASHPAYQRLDRRGRTATASHPMSQRVDVFLLGQGVLRSGPGARRKGSVGSELAGWPGAAAAGARRHPTILCQHSILPACLVSRTAEPVSPLPACRARGDRVHGTMELGFCSLVFLANPGV
ncbi:predicted protein [Verticillium alfalfae VaMs.102]|uniref:Predicted protein n=1 Tax=Verticillium alfalfae (strain VaMs.102 / ATCC MYA-4576 / FGSC 10136) TaxID=526221 RepID=C9SYV0_VERA1|nr:predicted protein [Verticillium alfalfae VaMs.102]EEY23965.1 predicted protein [Verticillium alfalfae VaMs.102]